MDQNTQTFRGRTIEDARSKAEETLGADAVIVHARRIRPTGFFGFLGAEEVELTMAPKARPSGIETRPPFALGREEPDRVDFASMRSEMQREVRSLRGLIVQRSSAPDGERALREDIAELKEELMLTTELAAEGSSPASRKLATMGVDRPAAKSLLKLSKELEEAGAGADALARAIAATVRAAAWPIAEVGRSLVCLVGPTGVGKTTTAAKLAARAIIDLDKTVMLVTCDAFRVGAIAQAERYASLLGAEFQAVSTRGELESVVAASTADVVLVDTAGRGPEERAGVESVLATLRLPTRRGEEPPARHALLCLSASSREVDAKQAAKFFAGCAPSALVITKVDETPVPAGTVHAAIATRLPIAAFTTGQRVPEDIEAASPKAVSRHLERRSRAPRERVELP